MELLPCEGKMILYIDDKRIAEVTIKKKETNGIKKIDDNKYNLKKCEDILVGTILVKDNNIQTKGTDLYFSREERKKNNRDTKIPDNLENEKTIVVILESPHKDEFLDNGESFPANGTTGNKLQEHFLGLIQTAINNLEDGEYKVILMNAIQYQCSLGVETNYYRDENFKNIWNNINSTFPAQLTKQSLDKRGLRFNPLLELIF
ncbi:hypothetical protein [Acetobacterium malicum]|uniref:hypothetical protein n=1 Tax=Acetobacterium malicum TaxID=52692 RepID=UPI000417461F|nr:hypothetical protein [Acetobacterium dehalogenans]